MQLIDYEGLKAKRINYSRPHLWQVINSSDEGFLRAVKIGGGGRHVWVESEIDAYIERNITERDSEEAVYAS